MQLREPVRQIGRRRFDFDRQVAVMAVINRTPDSFFDHGATFALDRAVKSALSADRAGADWVDIGGLAFSPDTPLISAAEEMDRVLPVVAGVAAASDVVISIDTWRPEVAAAAVAAGAAVINDTSGLRDPSLAELAAGTGATLVITHSVAAPHQHHPSPRYGDVVADVRRFLVETVQRAIDHGVPERQIVVDPGHDLNKSTRHTLELTRRFDEIASIGLPSLAAVSNKDFVGEALDRPKPERLAGSLAAATWCIQLGARVIRMHDVPSAVDTVRMAAAINGWRDPVHERHNV